MKKKKAEKNIIVGLDIGTSKIVAVVGECTPDDQIEIIGVGSHPSWGLKRGVVVNIKSTVEAIQRAVEEAELMAECEIYGAYTGIAGSHIASLNSHGIVAINDKEVHQTDIDRVLDAARAVAIPADQKILHVLPQEYIIDNQDSIQEPIGMSGVRLEAKVHMVTGAVSAAENIVKCVKRCGMQVSDVILEQLASSEAILSADEKNLGVCLIDIGAGTTDIAVFVNGAVRHSAVIPIAGDQVTNDIAVALRIPTQTAEQIKCEYATVASDPINRDAMIEIPTNDDTHMTKVSCSALAEVVEARYEELLNLVRSELMRVGLDDLIASGIVLTGGACKVSGMIELAESIFQRPVRLGGPQKVMGLTRTLECPTYATGIGLLLYGKRCESHGREKNVERTGVFSRVKEWFQGHF